MTTALQECFFVATWSCLDYGMNQFFRCVNKFVFSSVFSESESEFCFTCLSPSPLLRCVCACVCLPLRACLPFSLPLWSQLTICLSPFCLCPLLLETPKPVLYEISESWIFGIIRMKFQNQALSFRFLGTEEKVSWKCTHLRAQKASQQVIVHPQSIFRQQFLYFMHQNFE